MKRCLRFFVLIFALSASVVLRADTDAEVSARNIRAACLSHTIMP